MVCVPCTSVHMNLALSSNHSCSCTLLLIHCLFCACRWFSWGLTSSLHWCPACKIASRPRLAQVRGLCASVTITLPTPALADNSELFCFPGEHLGGSWVVFMLCWRAARPVPPLGFGGRPEGLCHCYSFFPEQFKCSCFLSLVLPSLLDRLGDSKDSVREQDQTLLLKIMEQAANPQVCATVHSMNDWLCEKRKPFFFQKVFSAIFLSEMALFP